MFLSCRTLVLPFGTDFSGAERQEAEMLAIVEQGTGNMSQGVEVLTPVREFQPVTLFKSFNTPGTRVCFLPQQKSPNVLAESLRAARAVETLGGRWTIPIVWELCRGPVRLGQLGRTLPGASRKVMTETLRRLEGDGILYREDLSGKTKHVEYHLNPHIKAEIGQLLEQLAVWGMAYDRSLKATKPVISQRARA